MRPPLNPDVEDSAPAGDVFSDCDIEHTVTYIRMLDADKDGADWPEVSRIVLRIDAGSEPDRARLACDSPLARAKWSSRHGYRQVPQR